MKKYIEICVEQFKKIKYKSLLIMTVSQIFISMTFGKGGISDRMCRYVIES